MTFFRQAFISSVLTGILFLVTHHLFWRRSILNRGKTDSKTVERDIYASRFENIVALLWSACHKLFAVGIFITGYHWVNPASHETLHFTQFGSARWQKLLGLLGELPTLFDITRKIYLQFGYFILEIIGKRRCYKKIARFTFSSYFKFDYKISYYKIHKLNTTSLRVLGSLIMNNHQLIRQHFSTFDYRATVI